MYILNSWKLNFENEKYVNKHGLYNYSKYVYSFWGIHKIFIFYLKYTIHSHIPSILFKFLIHFQDLSIHYKAILWDTFYTCPAPAIFTSILLNKMQNFLYVYMKLLLALLPEH